MTETISALRSAGVEVAPHVARVLVDALGSEQAAECARALSAPERAGLRMLPDPLPLTDGVRERFAGLALDERERTALLAAAVCGEGPVDVLVAASGAMLDELVAGPLGGLLSFTAGRFTFPDQSLRIWAWRTAPLSDRIAMHARVAEACRDRGDREGELWHRCLADLSGSDTQTSRLLGLARRAARRGDAMRAFRIADEVASRARGRTLSRARLIAAEAALAVGCLDEAIDRLTQLATDPEFRWRVLPALVVTKTFRTGEGAGDLLRWHPQEQAKTAWEHWGHAAVLVSGLCAERSQRSAAQTWLTWARTAALHSRVPDTHARAGEAWTLMLLGESAGPVAGGIRLGTVQHALTAGLAGQADAGIRLLQDADADADEALAPGFARSPLVRAYRVIAEALLRMWQGDMRAAYDLLAEAAGHCPLTLPFAGLGVAMARRLEIAIHGEEGTLSRSLGGMLPTQIDRLVDRGLVAYLRGDVDAAVVHLSLWAERGAPQGCLAIPGLDELGPLGEVTAVEPPCARLARELRARVRAVRQGAWEQELRRVGEAAVGIRSPFERARVEAILGTAYAGRGRFAPARRHLLIGQSLFDEAGAAAWSRSVTTRLARLADAEGDDARPQPLAVTDPLQRCRLLWEPLLTGRELEVAMHIAEGASNREIASLLSVSVRTVEVHAARVFSKLDVRTRAALTVLAYRTGHHG